MPKTLPAHTVPAVHLLQIVELVKRWHVTERALLSGLGLRARDVSDAQARVPVETFVALLERARTLTAEPGLGVYLGLQTRASGHGYLGFAAMSAPKFSDAIALAIRYLPIRTTAISLRGHLEGEAAVMTIDEHADFGAARDLVLFSVLIGLRQIGCALTDRELNLQMDFAMPEPPYFARFAHALPGARFDRPSNRLVGRVSGLDAPIKLYDPEALELARAQCETLLESLGLDGRIAARARAALTSNDDGFRSLEATAKELGLSARTLRRRLEAEGVSFGNLLRDERQARALTWLRSRELTIDEVATRLGYTDTANFTRAFRRWTGETPSAYRKRA